MSATQGQSAYASAYAHVMGDYIEGSTEGWGFVYPPVVATYWDHYWRSGSPICRPWTPPTEGILYPVRIRAKCPYCEAALTAQNDQPA